MKPTNILGAAGILSILAACPGTASAQILQAASTGTTVTSVTGAIAQLNYGSDGSVQGFLIGKTTLLLFPANICGGVESLGAVGNSVTYSGTEFTTTTGFSSVEVTSFTNTTSKVTYTHTTSTSTAYGPTSGTVKQLNYTSDGSIDGFLFNASGSTAAIFVSTGPRASATLTPLLTVGASVAVTGTTSVSLGGCTATGALEAVNASSLTIGSQTIVLAGGDGGFGGGRGGHH